MCVWGYTMAKRSVFNLNNNDDSINEKNKKDLKNLKEIKFEGDNNSLFWRFQADVLNPEAEIIVPQTHEVVFVKDGMLMNVLQGGRYPIFDYKKGIFSARKVGACSVDLVFISKTARLLVKWGTSTPFAFRDEATDILVHVRAFGEFEVRVKNSQKFYQELVGADKNFTISDLQIRLLQRLLSIIEPNIYKTLKEKHIPFEEITLYKLDIAENIKTQINQMFSDDYGLEVCSFTIGNISPSEVEVQALEKRRKELKDKEQEKKDAKEIAAELERLDDKNFEREKILHDLQSSDIDKYYDVLKILGWPTDGNKSVPNAKPVSGSHSITMVCPTCHNKFGGNMKFCPNDGTKLIEDGVCPSCHARVPENALFCPNCGQKLR